MHQKYDLETEQPIPKKGYFVKSEIYHIFKTRAIQANQSF